MTKISWEKNAVDFLKKIDAKDSNRIVKKIKQISCEVARYIEGLVGREEKKIRIGNYRLFVDYDKKEDELKIYTIKHRKNAYKK